MKDKIYNFLSKRLFWLAWISLVAIFLSQILGRDIWQLELFSHYTPHAMLVILSASFCYPRHLTKAIRVGFLMVGLVLLAWCVSPFDIYQFGSRAKNLPQKKTPITIAYQNVRIDNSHPKETLEQLTQQKVDMLILVEAGGEGWNSALEQLHEDYPVHCGNNELSFLAMQVFVADSQASCVMLFVADFPTIKITTADNRIIYVIHPPPPLNVHMASGQRAFLRAFKPLIQHQESIMVIGDMNLSAFSPIYRDFIADTGLNRLTARALPSWLPFGISIDQILVNTKTSTSDAKALDWRGSDHRGFLITW